MPAEYNNHREQITPFYPTTPLQAVVATTSNQSTALNGVGTSLYVANEGSVAANEHIDVKTGVGSQDASVGTVRRIYAGTYGTIPCAAEDTQFAIKATVGTPTVRVQRGYGLL
jgi:hypothetical protein